MSVRADLAAARREYDEICLAFIYLYLFDLLSSYSSIFYMCMHVMHLHRHTELHISPNYSWDTCDHFLGAETAAKWRAPCTPRKWTHQTLQIIDLGKWWKVISKWSEGPPQRKHPYWHPSSAGSARERILSTSSSKMSKQNFVSRGCLMFLPTCLLSLARFEVQM